MRYSHRLFTLSIETSVCTGAKKKYLYILSTYLYRSFILYLSLSKQILKPTGPEEYITPAKYGKVVRVYGI